MQSVALSGFFNPKVLNSMAALDDQTSMFSVAARDAVGSSGRIGMEYQRDKHGGRERFLEEALTLAIWGFGVRAIKQVYDAGMLGTFKGLGVKLPDLDTGVLPQAGKAIKPGQQILTQKVLDPFLRSGNAPQQYKVLEDILKKSSLKRTYQISSMAKFGAASILPAAAIAFAVPTFNQWLTRNIISKEAQSRQLGEKPGGAKPVGTGTTSNAAGQVPVASQPKAGSNVANLSRNPWTQRHGAKAAAFQPAGNDQSASGSGSIAQQAMASNPFMAHPASMAGQPFAQPQPGQAVRFGGVGSLLANGASSILQNEQYNTLLIDGVISGGRTYKARNPVERAEIIFREVSLILFLYFAQGHIQNAINKGLGKWQKIPTDLGFMDMQYIQKHLKERQASDPHFIDAFDADSKKIFEDMNAKIKAKYEGTGQAKVLAGGPEHRAQALVEVIHDYFVKHRNVPGKKNNVVFETAIHSGLIPTFDEKGGNPKLWEQLKDIGRELNPAADKKLTENPFLDLSKKIDTTGVLKLKDGMEAFVNSVNQNAKKELPEVLNHVMKLRAGSLIASNVACFAALSIIFPEIQHWITYKMTGKNYFPGVQGEPTPAEKKPQPQPQMIAAH